MEAKSILVVVLCMVIVGSMVFLHIRQKRK